ncbi:MAG: hypothetical protein E7350_03605 [Clostridiales bacterium]|nr:hypothetical protein [Clostridiales bacterium]
MIKIKLHLFESIMCAIFLPNAGFVFTTILFIISLIVEQDPMVYIGLMISYIVCLSLMILLLIICYLVNRKSKKEFILYCNNGEFEYKHHKYEVSQIEYCEYYSCKWYAIPIAFIYKQQVAGMLGIKVNTGERIYLRIFYKDYLKLKNYIQNIVVK